MVRCCSVAHHVSASKQGKFSYQVSSSVKNSLLNYGLRLIEHLALNRPTCTEAGISETVQSLRCLTKLLGNKTENGGSESRRSHRVYWRFTGANPAPSDEEAGASALLAVLTSPGVQNNGSVLRTLWLCRVPRPSARHVRSPDSRAYDCTQVTILTINVILKPPLSGGDDDEINLDKLSITVVWLARLRHVLQFLQSQPFD